MDATLSPDRTAWRQAVAAIAAKAYEKLPACNGRIDSAVKLVLAGDVELLPDGTALVASRSDASRRYTVNGSCTCQDYSRAPGHLCAHRLAYGIARRATELVPALPAPTPPAPAVSPEPLYEAPVSVNVPLEVCGRLVQLTIRGRQEWDVLARLEEVLQRYPQSHPPALKEQGRDVCRIHQCVMQVNQKNGRSWYSHRLPSGEWCKGK